MSLDLGRKESVPAALRRVVRKRIHDTLELIGGKPDSNTSERIHEARKQLKQVRALLRLMEPEVGHKRRAKADHRLREVARSLTPFRDATVLLATLQSLLPRGRQGSATLRKLRSILDVRRRRTRALALASAARRKALTKALRDAEGRIAKWSFQRRGWKAIGPGLERSYTASRSAAAAVLADHSDEALHESRKRAKDLLYTLQFLRNAGPAAVRSRIHAVHHLTDLLGTDHDLAVLQATLSRELRGQLQSTELQRLTTTVRKQRRTLQKEAREAARKIYAEDADTFIKQMHHYWRGWR